MRTAICINGLLRQPEESFDIINKSFVQPLESDVFIYSWNPTSNNSFLNNNRAKSSHTTEQLLQFSKKYFGSNLKNIVIEDYDTKINEMKKDLGINNLINPPYRFFPQCYKLCMSNKLRKDYQEENNITYDVVMFVRTEMFYYAPIQEEVIQQARNGLTCFCAAGDYGGLQTLLGVMNDENADKYCSMYNNYKNIYLKNQFGFFKHYDDITTTSFKKYNCPPLYKNNIMQLNSEYLYGYHMKQIGCDTFYRFPYSCGTNLLQINFDTGRSVANSMGALEYEIDPTVDYVCKLGKLPFQAYNFASLLNNNFPPHKLRSKLIYWCTCINDKYNLDNFTNHQLLEIVKKYHVRGRNVITHVKHFNINVPLRNSISIPLEYYLFASTT